MKKIVKLIVFMICIALVLSFLSTLSVFDDVKDDIKDRLNITKEDDSYYKSFKDGVFYVSSGDKMISYDKVSDIPVDLRGFFVHDDIVCYAIKVEGNSEHALNIEEEDLTYGGYEYCYYVTKDMVTFVNYSDTFSATIDGDALIIYFAKDNLAEEQIRALNDKLIANQPINIGYYDPPEIDGPGAE